jgi:hypothetical protein
MPDTDGPWGPRASPGLTDRQRSLIWVVLALAAAVVSWKLAESFRYASQPDLNVMRLFDLIGFLALLSAGVILSRRFRAKAAIRNIIIWGTVFAALGVCYTFNDMKVFTGPVRGDISRLMPSHSQ